MTEVELLKAELEFTIKARENLWELCRTLMDARHAEVKKEWVGLTGDEVQNLTHRKIPPWIWLLLKEFETKLKEKNT